MGKKRDAALAKLAEVEAALEVCSTAYSKQSYENRDLKAALAKARDEILRLSSSQQNVQALRDQLQIAQNSCDRALEGQSILQKTVESQRRTIQQIEQIRLKPLYQKTQL